MTLADLNVLISANIDQFEAAMEQAQRGVGRLGDGLKSAGDGLTRYVTVPLAGLAAGAVYAYGKLDGLQRGLNAINTQKLTEQGVSGLVAVGQASEQTARDLADLRDIARAPGIGFEQAVAGAVRLEAVGESAADAKEELKQFANAIALTGGGAQRLDEVTVQLAQLSAKGKVLSQDLRPILEQAPAAALAVKKLYGTIDSETISKALDKAGKSSSDFIREVTAELAKLPRVTGSVTNDLENFAQTATQAAAKLGEVFSKAVDLPGALNAIGSALERAADSFANLSPAGQKVIIGLAGAAAAAGPLLVAVGGVLAIIPQVVAGFGLVSGAVSGAGAAVLAFATNPVTLAIAGAAALAGGLYYLATAGERAAATYKEQAAETDRLTGTINPLLARYEELSAKAVRSEAEQKELASIMQQLADIVPGATKSIDEYGKATGISTQAVTAYTAALREQKDAAAALALPEATKELERRRVLYESLKQAQEQFNRTGNITTSGPALGPGGGSAVATYKASADEVAKLRQQLANANVAYLEQQGLVNELKGSTQGLADAAKQVADAQGQVVAKTGLLADLEARLKAAREARPALTTVAEVAASNALISSLQLQIKQLNDLGNAQRENAESFRAIERESLALGSSFDYLSARRDADLASIKRLLAAGVAPNSAAIRSLRADYNNLNNTLAATEQIGLRVAKGLENFNKPKDFQLELPKLEKLPETLAPMPLVIGPVDVEGILASLDATKQGFTQFSDAQAAFNENTQKLLEAFPGQLFSNVGQAIGNALGNGTDALEAAGKALLKSLADLGAQFGQYLIALGIANLAVPGLQGLGVAQIAGGGALVLAAGVLGGFASASSSGSSGSTGAAGGAFGPTSQPRSFTPTTAPAASNYSAGKNVHTVIFDIAGNKLRGVLQIDAERTGRISGLK